MRRFILLAIRIVLAGLCFIVASTAWANQRANVLCAYTGTVTTSGLDSSNQASIVYPYCQIKVTLTGTTIPATIYSDNSNTIQLNPFAANNLGMGYFYAALGRYDITISPCVSPSRCTEAAMPGPLTIGDVLLQDATSFLAALHIDPSSQIQWPLITGTGTPAVAGVSCSAGNYGQPYQDTSVTPNVVYTCGTDGWAIRGGGLPAGCTSPGVGSITCSGTVSVPTSMIPTGLLDVRSPMCGAKGDTVQLGKATISAGSLNTVTLVTGSFATTDTGKTIVLNENDGLHTDIVSVITVVNATTATLTTPSTRAVTAVDIHMGTDDSAAFQTCKTYADAKFMGMYVPNSQQGCYLITKSIKMGGRSNFSLVGDGQINRADVNYHYGGICHSLTEHYPVLDFVNGGFAFVKDLSVLPVYAYVGSQASAGIFIGSTGNTGIGNPFNVLVNPAVGDTITVNGTLITYIANGGTPVGNQVALGATATATATALYNFLAASSDANISLSTWTNPSAGKVVGTDKVVTCSNGTHCADNVTLSNVNVQAGQLATDAAIAAVNADLLKVVGTSHIYGVNGASFVGGPGQGTATTITSKFFPTVIIGGSNGTNMDLEGNFIGGYGSAVIPVQITGVGATSLKGYVAEVGTATTAISITTAGGANVDVRVENSATVPSAAITFPNGCSQCNIEGHLNTNTLPGSVSINSSPFFILNSRINIQSSFTAFNVGGFSNSDVIVSPYSAGLGTHFGTMGNAVGTTIRYANGGAAGDTYASVASQIPAASFATGTSLTTAIGNPSTVSPVTYPTLYGGWRKLGTQTLTTSSESVLITLDSSYVNSGGVGEITYVQFIGGNVSNGLAPNVQLLSATTTGFIGFVQQIKAVAASTVDGNNKWDIYVLLNASIRGSYTVTEPIGGTWQDAAGAAAVDPGPISSTVAVGTITSLRDEANNINGANIASTTHTGNVNIIPLTTPLVPAVALIATGGTLADSTQYCYTVAAQNAVGHSIQSPEACITTGTPGGTSSATVTWNMISNSRGVVSWRVSRGLTLAEQPLTTAPTDPVMPNFLFVDTGALNPSGSALTTNTSQGAFQLNGVALATPPTGTTATLTPGTNVTSTTCATAACTNLRGSFTVVGGTATTGTIAVLSWTATPTAYVCTATMNGGAAAFNIGNSVATTTGMNITAGISVVGATFVVNYSCQP